MRFNHPDIEKIQYVYEYERIQNKNKQTKWREKINRFPIHIAEKNGENKLFFFDLWYNFNKEIFKELKDLYS